MQRGRPRKVGVKDFSAITARPDNNGNRCESRLMSMAAEKEVIFGKKKFSPAIT
jgi:hypothetical protein